ncbi:ribulose-phosphate 3-epimerase [bacterium]
MRRIQVYPSLLAADFSNLGQEIATVENAGADGIHFDVMDGHFVPNISFGSVVLAAIRGITTLPFWVHLMITDPHMFITDFIDAGANGIFIHPEIDGNISVLSKEIKQKGVQPGMAINPETKIEDIKELLPYFQDFLIMTVQPGFGGQVMLKDALIKIQQIKKLAKDWNAPPVIHVDGGVNFGTVQEVVKAGADVLVAGSSIFKQPNQEIALKQLRKQALESLNSKE